MSKPEARGRGKSAKILIVDDHPIVREGLALHLATRPDWECCGQAEDIAGAMAAIEATRPNVVIVDISLRSGNGIDLIKRIRARDQELRILVLSMYPESLYAERALRAGAQGYLHKSAATRQLIDAIEAVLAGKIYVSGDITDQLLGRMVSGRPPERPPVETLSPRELEVFELIGQGLTTAAIAERMHVSAKTLETYRARIKQKLNLDNINALIQRATRWVIERA